MAKKKKGFVTTPMVEIRFKIPENVSHEERKKIYEAIFFNDNIEILGSKGGNGFGGTFYVAEESVDLLKEKWEELNFPEINAKEF